jgi:predicted transcriptional regulator of viral defense system
MKYGKLLELLGDQGFFDLASVVQLSGERRESIRMQLYRWSKAEKLLPLRRGMYAFSENYRRRKVNHAELANQLYIPSYISVHWALGFLGLIPEKVVTYTSVTSRAPRVFANDFGVFRYQHIKSTAFFGYCPVQIDGRRVLLADREKALLDLWHLEKGQWDDNRMAEMRFQNPESINVKKLCEYAKRFNSPRLLAAVDVWSRVCGSQPEGTVEL